MYDEMFVVWLDSPEWLQSFLSHLISLSSFIQFTMEMGSDSAIPFLEALVLRKRMTLVKITSSDLTAVTCEKRFNLEYS
jgi:hypothetical protein